MKIRVNLRKNDKAIEKIIRVNDKFSALIPDFDINQLGLYIELNEAIIKKCKLLLSLGYEIDFVYNYDTHELMTGDCGL